MRLDIHDDMPSGMRQYLGAYGWHFSKKMCDWAVSGMKTKDGDGKMKPIEPYSKEDVDALMKKYGISVSHNTGYDCVYVANMAKADYFKSSLSDDAHIALFVKDYIDDPDGYDGLPFTRFYADCIGSGKPIIWEDMM